MRKRIPKWVKDANLWGVIIALIAVVLSQLPPVADMAKGRKIDAAIDRNLELSHELGNIHIALFVDIENTGGLSVTVDRILCCLLHSSGRTWNLPARYFVSRALAGVQSAPCYPMTTISLEPGKRWSESVLFWSDLAPTDEAEARSIGNAIGESILQRTQTALARDMSKPPPTVEADPAAVNQAKQFFARIFDLPQGEYKVLVYLISQPTRPLCTLGYRFRLEGDQIDILRSYVDHYRWGGGVVQPIVRQKVVMVHLESLDANETRELAKKLRIPK